MSKTPPSPAPDSESEIANQTIRGMIWVSVSTYSGKFLVFLSTIILARLLTQEDYGVAGYALVFISFLDVLDGLGIRAALIYHKRDPKRTNTGFWLGLMVGVGLFALTWITAPLAGWFFRDPQAVPVTRALGFVFPIAAFGIVHDALLRKELAFKKRVIPEFARTLSKGIMSITLAWLGYGAWSLIFGQLLGVFVSTVALWIVVSWRPKFEFQRAMVRPLLSYGSRIVMVNGLGILLLNVDYLLIGRYLGAASLGVYTLAFRVPELLIKQFSSILGKVIFPAYAKMRATGKDLSRGFLLTLQYVNLVTVPLGLGLALVASPFVLTFFTDKWIEAIPVMRAISLYTLLRAMVFNTGDVYKAEGRPEVMIRIKVWQAVISLPILFWAAAIVQSIEAVAWAQVGLAFGAGLVKLEIAGHMLTVSRREMLSRLRPSLMGGAFMVIAVVPVLWLTAVSPPFIQLTLASITGGLAYAGFLFVSERPLIIEATQTIRGALPNKGGK